MYIYIYIYIYIFIFIYILYIYILYNIYLYIYINIYIIQRDIFFKSVIFQILRIFNGLLQTKSVKKYILSE